MTRIEFHGRVAIVTGAGRGIGRAYANLLAARGATVLVNDVGVSMDGSSSENHFVAADVAEAIAARGHTAWADTSDIATTEGARALVDRAVADFGRVDIVVNNAGIYSLDNFPDIDLDTLRRHFDVHVGGSFNVTRAAWPHLAATGSGRVVMTTSTGALGSENMVAYGTAKGAVLALGRALAHAGKQHGIKVNMVAPMAMTRMMAAGAGMAGEPPQDPVRSPQLVAPLVAVLCHDLCPTTAETYVSGMRRMSTLFIAENAGYTHTGLDLSPEDVLDHWSEVIDRQHFTVHTGTLEQSIYLGQFVEPVANHADSR